MLTDCSNDAAPNAGHVLRGKISGVLITPPKVATVRKRQLSNLTEEPFPCVCVHPITMSYTSHYTSCIKKESIQNSYISNHPLEVRCEPKSYMYMLDIIL